MKEIASPIHSLKNGQWFKVIRFTDKSNIPALCNSARQFLTRFSGDDLSFEYIWFTVSEDVTYLVVTGTRTSLTVLTAYLDTHTRYADHAVIVRDGRGAKVFESIVSRLYAKRVPVKGRHSQARSVQR